MRRLCVTVRRPLKGYSVYYSGGKDAEEEEEEMFSYVVLSIFYNSECVCMCVFVCVFPCVCIR